MDLKKSDLKGFNEYLWQRPNRGWFFTPRLAPSRKKLSPPRPGPPLVFILRPRPASPREKLSPPRPAPSRFFKVFLLTVLAPKAAMERIFYSPPRPPRLYFLFFIPAPPRPAKSSPRPDSPPRFGPWSMKTLSINCLPLYHLFVNLHILVHHHHLVIVYFYYFVF